MGQSILDKIKACITEYKMIEPGDGVVVGLSGGPDSVCLFHSLCSLRQELGISSITAVHINHCLRGEESDGDQAYAGDLARSNGADFVVFRYDVGSIAAASGEGTEEAGRRLRYAAFEKVRREKGAARIAVAHNMNDQAETILMRLMRGTGLRGLCGIDHVREDGIVIRPVLDLTRQEIEQYCREKGLEPHIDSTNARPVYTRNKIRLQLLPQMQQDYNPGVIDALVRLSRQAREDEDCLISAAMKYTDEGGVKRWDDREKSLVLEGFSDLHPSVAKRVIMLCAARAGMKQNTSMTGIEKAYELAAAGAEARETDLSDGYYVRISYGKLWILRRKGKKTCSRREEQGQGPSPVRLPVESLMASGGETLEIGYDDIRIRLRLLDRAEAGRIIRMVKDHEKGNKKQTGDDRIRLLLDLDAVASKGEAVFRYRQPGDRISPIGMKGSKRLQDFFTDRKIPKHLRDTTLLLVAGGRVISAGGEVSSECPVARETAHILSIEY